MRVRKFQVIIDVCKCIRPEEFAAEPNKIYLMPKEQIMLLLRSGKETHMFTNLSYIQIKGESAHTSRRLVRRFDYFDSPIGNVCYESAGVGVTDRDVELKFTIKGESVSIDIWKSEAQVAIFFYKILAAIENFQARNHLLLTLVKESAKGISDPFSFALRAQSEFCPEDYSSIFDLVMNQK